MPVTLNTISYTANQIDVYGSEYNEGVVLAAWYDK